MLKYCWPRYAPPPDAGIMSSGKSENLSAQFARLIAMHHEAPASFPMPVGTVTSTNDEFVGYLLEYVRGETLQTLLSLGMVNKARRQLEIVRRRLPGCTGSPCRMATSTRRTSSPRTMVERC